MKDKEGLPFAISFDTKDMPGKIKAVIVTLDVKIMTLDDEVRVDLFSHPLYPRLERYVLANLKKRKVP